MIGTFDATISARVVNAVELCFRVHFIDDGGGCPSLGSINEGRYRRRRASKSSEWKRETVSEREAVSEEFRWVGGGGTARGIPKEAASRMVTVVSGGGVDGLASKAGEAAWASDLRGNAPRYT